MSCRQLPAAHTVDLDEAPAWERHLYCKVDGQTRMPRLAAARAATLLLQVAAERPDYIHPWREYLHDGKPGCLVAHVLHRAGGSLEALDGADVADETGGPLPVTRLPDTRHFALLTAEAADLLGVAQRAQDSGLSWGAAARAAIDAKVGAL